MSSRLLVFLFIGVGIIGVLFLVAGIVLHFVLDALIKERIKESVQLREGTEQYERWKQLPFPLLYKVYVFNVTNPDAILTGAQPIVEEIGPWVYTQYREKENITYDEEDDTLTYKPYNYLLFDDDKSPLAEDTNITVLNMPLQGIFLGAGDFPQSTNNFWPAFFNGDGYFLTLPARQFFFDGYEFCTRATLNAAQNTFCNRIKLEAVNSNTLTSDSDKITFALFAYKLNETDGEYKISAGNKDVNTIGEILSWEELEYLSTWEGGNSSTCNRIRGRDSSIYPPYNNDNSRFDVFNTDICRIASLQVIRRAEYQGIDGIMAAMTADEMKNTGDKDCYCVKGSQDLDGEFECFPDGFADMSTCLGSSAIASFPHMLWANTTYSRTVEGLEPNEEKHMSFVILEPGTGTPLQGAKRMQFNMVLRPLPRIEITENLQPAIFPVMWVEETFDLPEHLVQKLKDDYLSQLTVVAAITWTLIGAGIALIVISGGYFLVKCIRK